MICLAGSTTVAAKFKGSKTDEIVDSTPCIELGLFKSAVYSDGPSRVTSKLNT